MKLFLILILSMNLSWAVDYNRDIKSILSRNCFSCHGKNKQKGKLRLDFRAEALKALSQNEDGKIPLLERINHSDPEEIMPPPKEGKLTDKEKKLLVQWIKQGAEYGKHWALIPPIKSKIPDINSEWISNDIDKFILQKIEAAKLEPNPVHFDYKLLRRISLMLTGLPPSLKSYEKFVNGQLDYNSYVDFLLNSKAYGEHMAVNWLDSARYGDTNGIQYDSSRPIWPYRDWVINAFNSNMPYDQFLTEQIAGDLLPNASISQKVATGFLRCNVTTNEMGSIEEEFKVRNAKDRLNTTMTTFVGLTVGCAECHDHKYDPLSQKEYYQMIAYFNNIDGRDSGFPYERSDPPLVSVISKEKNQEYESITQKIEDLDTKMAFLKSKAGDNFWWWHYQTMAKPPKDIYLMSQLDSYFPFDEKYGSTASNLISEKRCNIKGPVFRTEGKFGKALRFNNLSYIDCRDAGTFVRNTPLSIGFWIKPVDENKGTILGKFDTRKNKGWKLEIENGFIFFHLNSSEDNLIQVETGKALPLNEWTHLTVTYDGSSKAKGVKFYINQEPARSVITKDLLTNDILTPNNMRIGVETHGRWLTACSIDEVFTAKKELNQNEIKTISNFKSASRFALISPDQLSTESKEELLDYYLKYHHKEYSNLYKQKLSLNKKAQSIVRNSPMSMVMKERKEMRPAFILEGGNYEKPRKKVSRKLPDFLKISEESFDNNRLGFARWLTHNNHPLTSRVIVNRIWMKLMGKALVRSPADFGIQGDFPTHPELLDHLAIHLIENKWNIKKLIKYIVSSSAFKQSSKLSGNKLKIDPENIFYSYYLRRRMTAEMIRDNTLAVTGLLTIKTGGPPVFPYQPPGFWDEAISYLSNLRHYRPSSGEDKFRRSIYTFWKRNLPPPAMTIFDAPNRQHCVVERNQSNTPLQALVLLNDKQFLEMYNWNAAQLDKSDISDPEKVKQLYKMFFFRKPNTKELKFCLDFLKKNNSNSLLLISSLLNTDEAISVE